MRMYTMNAVPRQRRRGLRGLGDVTFDPSTWGSSFDTSSPVDTSTVDTTSVDTSSATSDFTPPDNIDTSGLSFPGVPTYGGTSSDTTGAFNNYFTPDTSGSSGPSSTASSDTSGFNWGSFFSNLSQTALSVYKAKLTAQTAQAAVAAPSPKPISPTTRLPATQLRFPALTNPVTGQTNWGAVAMVGAGAVLLIALMKRG